MNADSNQSDDESEGADPLDAELIAYLDGELEPTEARRMEDRLDADSQLRSRAEALKRSYDLLDFLPKPEPTPTFATRTMDKLPVSASAARSAASNAAITSTPIPVASSMSSLALPMQPHPGAPWWLWAAGIFVAAALALGAGYLSTAAARAYFFTPPSAKDDSETLPLADVHIIEKLPLYSVVDDLEFLNQLGTPEYFGEEHSAPESTPLPLPEADKPSSKQLEDLWRTFRELPSERQEKIRKLDQQINALEPAKRDRTQRLLETYAAWLQRLADSDRKEILSAPTPAKRIEAIREVHIKQWIAGLPATQRQKLANLTAIEKAELIAKWRSEEDKNRADWAFTRLQWDSIRTNRQPWPFMDEQKRKETMAFVHAAYHPDDPKHNRLDLIDSVRMKEAMDRAEKGEWVHFGKVVYECSKKYEMLPEPGKGNPVIEIDDLKAWPIAHKHYETRPKLKERIDRLAGKWPEFALLVAADANANKLGSQPASFHLGPSKPDEFKAEVRNFLSGEFKKKVTDTEASALKLLEGQWPAYPRELIRLAKLHDLSVPGAMPPGPPSLWEKTYNPQRPMRAGG